MVVSLTLTNVSCGKVFAVRTKEARFAEVAIDSLRVVHAVEANPTSLIPAVDIQGRSVPVHLLVIIAFVAVSVTVARCSPKNQKGCPKVPIVKTWEFGRHRVHKKKATSGD